MTNTTIENPQVVSREEWLAARKQHLRKEKEFTRLWRDRGLTSFDLSADRESRLQGWISWATETS